MGTEYMEDRETGFSSGRKLLLGILTVLLVGIIVVLAILLVQLLGSMEKEEIINTVTVTTGTIRQTVSGDGNISQENMVQVTTTTSAKITSVNCNVGDTVKKGDVLYELGTKTVTAPMNGMVLAVNYAVGDTYDGDSGDAMAVIADNSSFEVSFSVDESYITQISKGKSATITVKSAFPSDYEGTVSGYDLMGTTENGVTTYSVSVVFDVPDDADILNGMSAVITVTLEEKENILKIPSGAVDRNGNVTIVDTNGAYRSVEVELGICDDSYVEIISGLSEGDVILANP